MCRDEFRLKHFKLWHSFHRDFTDSKVKSQCRFICVTLNVQSSLQSTGYLLKYDIYSYSDLLIVGLTCMFMKT